MIRPASLRAALLSLLILLLGTPSSSRAAAPKPKSLRLTILHTNDMHGALFPFRDESGKTVGGMARRATLIRRLREKQPNSLLLDAGDIWERGPLAAQYRGEPEVRAMNALGYQAMTLGNNEFRDGIANLRRRIAEARFPVLSANVRLKSTGRTLGKPYTILNVAGVRVGIFGLTTPRITTYPGTSGLEVSEVTAEAAKVLKELRPKADLIVALTHIAFPIDLILGYNVPGIDVIVGGDSHTRLDQPFRVPRTKAGGAGPVVVQAGDQGRWLGELNLTLTRNANGRYRVSSYTGRLHPITADLPPDPRVEALLEPYARRLQRIPTQSKAAVKPSPSG